MKMKRASSSKNLNISWCMYQYFSFGFAFPLFYFLRQEKVTVKTAGVWIWCELYLDQWWSQLQWQEGESLDVVSLCSYICVQCLPYPLLFDCLNAGSQLDPSLILVFFGHLFFLLLGVFCVNSYFFQLVSFFFFFFLVRARWLAALW